MPGMPPRPTPQGGKPGEKGELDKAPKVPGYQLPPASMAPDIDARAGPQLLR